MRPSQYADRWQVGKKKFLAAMQCQRAYNPQTKCYLHLSGTSETNNVEWSWRGSKVQFRRLNIDHSKYRLIESEDEIPGLEDLEEDAFLRGEQYV